MKRLLPLVAALALAGGAIACTDKKHNDTSQPAAANAATSQATTSTLVSTRATGNAAPAASGASNATDVVKTVRPSVVRIRANGQQTSPFGVVQGAAGTGTGFIVDARGYIVTNNHVVTLGTATPVNRLDVDLWDGRTVQATLIGRDERTDLAVIKIDAGNLTPVKFADPNAVQVGDDVLAIGFALDLGATPTVTRGVVSATDRVIDETLQSGRQTVANSISGAIQTDAAVNPGNSGGPLLNLNSEVVGVNTAGLSGSQGESVQGIFFAVGGGVAEPIVRSLIDKGKVERGYLGVSLTTVNDRNARAQNSKAQTGAGVESVDANTPAGQAGLKAGDVITKVGDKAITNIGDVTNALANYQPGQKVKVEYVRGSNTSTVDVTLGTRPDSVP